MAVHLDRSRLAALCGALGLIAFLGTTLTPVAASSDAPAGVVVQMSDNRFQPATVHIHAGDVVTWNNSSGLEHTVTGSGWGSGKLGAGASYSHSFDRPGTYEYHCEPHAAMGMVGRVVVDSK